MLKSIKYVLTSFALVLSVLPLFANGGAHNAYSPYSKFGIGRLNDMGTAYNRTMGGTGTATRDNKYVNIMNPASVTARDSLSFMMDFSLAQNNVYFAQNDLRSVNNTFNIENFSISFPIYKSSAMMLGITPFSSVGYDFSGIVEDKDVIGHTGNIADLYSGSGSLYQVYVSGAVTFWKRLSIGGEFDFYFGKLEKNYSRTFEASNYRSLYEGNSMSITGFGGKIGLQYEETIAKKHKITLGGTYRIKTDLKGHQEDIKYALQSEVTDTVTIRNTNISGVNIPQEFSVGLSYRYSTKFRAEVDYTRSDWKSSGMDAVNGFRTGAFTSSVSQKVNAGFEYTPNRNDIRYYMRRVSYRVGAYYGDDYYCFNGNKISSYGLTLGMTLPVFRWYNGITVGMDIGQRGSLKNDLVRERYIGFSVGFNIFDVWFVKPKYE